MLEYMLACCVPLVSIVIVVVVNSTNVIARRRRRLRHLVDRLVTGEGFSCGDGDDQSLSFFKMLGRFMGGEASVTLAQLRFARICNQIHCDYDWRNHKQQEQIPDNFGSIFRR